MVEQPSMATILHIRICHIIIKKCDYSPSRSAISRRGLRRQRKQAALPQSSARKSRARGPRQGSASPDYGALLTAKRFNSEPNARSSVCGSDPVRLVGNPRPDHVDASQCGHAQRRPFSEQLKIRRELKVRSHLALIGHTRTFHRTKAATGDTFSRIGQLSPSIADTAASP